METIPETDDFRVKMVDFSDSNADKLKHKPSKSAFPNLGVDKMAKILAKMELRVPVEITKKDRWFVASCPVLDVVTQGKTEKSARRNLGEALELFLTTCFEMGTLEDVLKTCGFKLVPPKEKLKDSNIRKVKASDYLDIPLHLLANNSGMDCCHV